MLVGSRLLFVFTTFSVFCVWSHPDHPTSSQAVKRARSAGNDLLDKNLYETRCNGIQSQKDRNSRRIATMPTSKQSQARKGSHSAAKGYKRDLEHILQRQHGFIRDADEEVVIFSDPASYRLQGEMTSGPYYVDGELVRSNITEGKEGIPLFLDIQFIDTSTCQPIEGIYVDVWHCKATGVYSGVKSMDNGNFGDEENIDTSFLRGIQQTDANGAVQFLSVFPGHYTGMPHHYKGDNC